MKEASLQRTMFWNRRPGVFVNKNTGEQVQLVINGQPVFDGTVQEWYETLIETLIDLKNHLEKDVNARADRCTVCCDPDVFCILNASVLFKPSVNDSRSGMLGTMPMKVFEDREQTRFQITVVIDYQIGGRTYSKMGRVHVLED